MCRQPRTSQLRGFCLSVVDFLDKAGDADALQLNLDVKY